MKLRASNLKKKYGQNFLIDKNITNKIVNLIDNNNLNISYYKKVVMPTVSEIKKHKEYHD